MKNILFILLTIITFGGCSIEEDQFLSTPLILVFPVGKSWQIQDISINETQIFVSDTDTVHFSGNLTYLFNESDNLFFYNPVGSDPNAGRIETYYIWGTWKSEITSSNLEFLTLNFPTNGGEFHKYSFLNGKWRITDKWSNKIQMEDYNSNHLTLIVP